MIVVNLGGKLMTARTLDGLVRAFPSAGTVQPVGPAAVDVDPAGDRPLDDATAEAAELAGSASYVGRCNSARRIRIMCVMGVCAHETEPTSRIPRRQAPRAVLGEESVFPQVRGLDIRGRMVPSG